MKRSTGLSSFTRLFYSLDTGGKAFALNERGP